ncbi:hypothetical protein ABK040_005634 [Willaertia magna]
MSQHQSIFTVLLCFFLLAAATDLSIQQQTNHVYNWGRNLDSELGILLENSIPLPKHLPNIEAKLKSIDSTGFYNDSNIQIIQGYKFTYFISNSFDNNTQKFIEYSKLLGCGYNGDFTLGAYVPIIISDPIPPYRYTAIGEQNGNYKNNQNNLYGKTIRFMSCSISCLMVANDGLVYIHNAGSSNYLDYYLVPTLPKTLNPPETPQVTIQLNYTKVAVCGTELGKETFFALSDTGYLYVWGGSPSNGYLLRGDGTQTTALALLNLRNVTDVYCKGALVVAIANNKMYFWGAYDSNTYLTPAEQDTSTISLYNYTIIKVTTSGTHVLLLTENGNVYGMGYNNQGQINGNGNTPLVVNSLFNITSLIAGGQKRIKDIYANGPNSSGALTEDNLLYTWGSDGIGRTGGSLPQLIALPEDDNKVLHASISNNFGYMLTTNRKIYGFGLNSYDAQLCDGSLKNSPTPLKLTNGSDSSVIEFSNYENKTAIQIVSGGSHNLLLLGDGSLYIWGRCFSRMSTIPDGNQDVKLPPTLLPSSLFNGEKIISVDSKNVHIAVLTSNGNVYTWGDATNYKLGNKNNQGAVATPFKVDLPIPAKAIAVGSQHTIILLNNGSLIGVGGNDKGQLGIGYLSTSEVDFKLADTSAVPTNDDIIQIACTQSTSYIVTRSGRLYSTGDNTEGVANGGSQPSNIKQFTQVTSVGRVTKIITGANRSAFVIAVDGRAFNLNVGVSQITLPNPSDQLVINGAIAYSNAFIITSKRNVYGRGGNNAFQISNDNTVISSSSMIKYNGNINGEIPYLISITSGNSGSTSIQLVTVKEYQCFGKNSTDFSKVCSGRGICLTENVCQCFSPYSGDDCSVACFGKSKDDSTVCSGHGQCIGLDKCQCNQGYFGEKCQYVSCYGNEEKLGYTRNLCVKINNVLLNNS